MVSRIRNIDQKRFDFDTAGLSEGLVNWCAHSWLGLDRIEIRALRRLVGSRCIHLLLDLCGEEQFQQIRLDTDGEDLPLEPGGGVQTEMSLRTWHSYESELTDAQYQRVIQAKTLTLKVGGNSFLLTAEHIAALRNFAEADDKLSKRIF